MTNHQPLLELHQVAKSFVEGDHTLEILKAISLEIYPGEIVGLLGASGSGKSTLLHIAGLLETPEVGEVRVKGQETSKLSDTDMTHLRAKSLGFVYQYHHLLPEFTALENIMIPQMNLGVKREDAHRRAKDLLTMVSLSNRATHFPSELSGGEQQRVAIARALANSPLLLLADEPTGNLDEATADHVFQALLTIVRTSGLSALVVTHDQALARKMDRVLMLHHGRAEAWSG